MGDQSFTDMPVRMAEDIVKQVDELDEESNIEYSISEDTVDISFSSEDFNNYNKFIEVDEEIRSIIKEQYRKGDKCPHSASNDCVETITYQQSSGLSIAGHGVNLSGGEVVQVCATCETVLKVIKEASATGE